ncbi:MAG: PAS domain-containing protein, partial [Candidatus Eisenbacteria bacterium]
MARTLRAPAESRVRAPRAKPAGPRTGDAAPAELAGVKPLGEVLSDALVYADDQLRVRYLNREACRLLGCTPAWAVGRPGSEVLRTAVPNEDLFAETPGERASERETLLLTRTGSEVPARVTLARLPGGGTCAIARDLTQAQRLQRELRMRERLATVGELA